jgi:hypothetical protein
MELDINLSDKKSIKSAIKSLKNMQTNKDFDNAVVNRLVDKCYERCMDNLENMQHQLYPSTQFRAIKNAVTKEYAQDGVGYIKIKSPAIFVELGTGLKGKTGKHPEAENFKWVYGDNGWYYPTDAGASNPNKFQNENGDWYGYTLGQPARPFAYNAAIYIRSIVKDEVKISFKNITH